jgi:NADH-quinone oxidoreductase subunit G
VLKAIAELKGVEIPDDAKNALSTISAGDTARAMAASLNDNKPAAVFIGNLAQHHPRYADICKLAQYIAQISDARFGVLGEAANSVGAYIAGAIPFDNRFGNRNADTAGGSHGGQGANASQMLGMDDPAHGAGCKAYVLLNLEPELDSYNSQCAVKTLAAADLVVMMSAYKSHAAVQDNYADVLLPIAPFTETSGTFISTEGRVQSFNGVVAPLGEARPAWKVLRVLGNILQLDGFDYETPEQVRADVLPVGNDVSAWLNNSLGSLAVSPIEATRENKGEGLQRIGEVPIYQADLIVRRAESLQRTRDAAAPLAWMPGSLMAQLGLQTDEVIRLKQGEGEVRLPVAQDDSLPANCIRIASAHPSTAALGGMFDQITVEKS